MRYLVLSDIHGNLEALEAVLTAARATDWDAVLVLGDLVGYGADPNAVVERVRALAPRAIIRGNHDRAVTSVEPTGEFNRAARHAIEWTRATLTADNHAYLAALPSGPTAVDGLVEICHGAPRDEDDYVVNERDIRVAFALAGRPLCVFGHTHVAVVYGEDAEGPVLLGPDADGAGRLAVVPGRRYLVNPGSVGQPRDGDPRASYGVIDTTRMEIEIHRVDYPVERAQARIREAGLPAPLADRLAIGR